MVAPPLCRGYVGYEHSGRVPALPVAVPDLGGARVEGGGGLQSRSFGVAIGLGGHVCKAIYAALSHDEPSCQPNNAVYTRD